MRAVDRTTDRLLVQLETLERELATIPRWRRFRRRRLENRRLILTSRLHSNEKRRRRQP